MKIVQERRGGQFTDSRHFARNTKTTPTEENDRENANHPLFKVRVKVVIVFLASSLYSLIILIARKNAL